MKDEIKQIVKRLNLQQHPEGGYYRETYRSRGTISKIELGEGYKGSRNYSTCIYYLLTADTFSAFHRIPQDEIWHFYQGNPLRIHMITEHGEYQKIDLGASLQDSDGFTGEQQVDSVNVFRHQGIVPGNSWFAAEILISDTTGSHKEFQESRGLYSLVGCTVAPGFHFSDFELAERKNLIAQFPQYSKLITCLTK